MERKLWVWARLDLQNNDVGKMAKQAQDIREAM